MSTLSMQRKEALAPSGAETKAAVYEPFISTTLAEWIDRAEVEIRRPTVKRVLQRAISTAVPTQERVRYAYD